MKKQKKIAQKDYKWFAFKHKKLNDKAKEYRHEVLHIVKDLYLINQRIHKSLVLSTDFITILGKPKKRYQISDLDSGLRTIEELRYHMENFIYRIQPYRDKLLLFVNFAINVGFREDERMLMDNLLQHHLIKRVLIDTELEKFKEDPFKNLLTKRKVMSHRSYYQIGLYSEHFMPNDENLSPRKIGVKKASIEWRRNIKKEPEQCDKCLRKIFDLNNR